MNGEPSVVWAVVFSNDVPPDIEGLYDNEDAALAHVENWNKDGDSGWGVVRWRVASTYPYHHGSNVGPDVVE